MGNLILNSLEIRRFRAFEHLQIEHLGRVNLIVGKNNVGKSSFLEALQLYANRGNPLVIWEILSTRDEGRRPSPARRVDVENLLSVLKYLFYGRREARSYLEPIQIGPVNSSNNTLSVSVAWYKEEIDEEGRRRVQLSQGEKYDTVDSLVPRFVIQMGSRASTSYSLDISIPSKLLPTEFKEIRCVFTSSNGLDKRQIGELWDNIALTNLEKEVLNALRIIAPGIEGLNLVSDPASTRERIPIVKVAGIDDPLPLRSLGDGMQRVLGIALALVNARDGMLLIDEFENGLHYSAQTDIWRLIFRIASHLNVQVFATTHSWDCIEAFQRAAQEDSQNEGLLIRLESKKDKIVATLFDERRLGIATREQIEVR